MKTAKNFVALVFALVSFSVFGADARVFVAMSGESFPVFKESLEKAGKLQKEQGVEFFDTKVLAEAACAFGKEKLAALHEKYGTAEKCQGVFLARNNLGAIMTLDDFRVQGQGVGFWLADISSKSSGAVASKAAASESKTVVAAPQENKALNALTAGFASLKKRFDALYTDGGGLMTKDDVEAILKQQHEEEAARNKETSARFEALEAQANTTIATVNTLGGRVDGVEKTVNNSVLLKWENVVLGILGTIVLALVAMAFRVYRKAVTPMPQRGTVPNNTNASNEATLRQRA